MLPFFHDITECLDYPGKYIPLPETEKLLDALRPAANTVSSPLLNMDEYNECYKLAIVIPGAKREELLVYIHDNILCVAAVHKQNAVFVKKTTVHEFDTACFQRHIALPQDADMAFIYAAFSEGLLNLYIPKSGGLTALPGGQVVVY